ncbi:MAG: HD domain-containing phosphohydrolase [Bacillota bacterium]
MSEKILLVDDDSNILSGYERILRKKFEVVTAENAIEGGVALQEKGPFAVVVSDYRMPGIDGVKFLATVRKASPDTVRLMLTGQADMQAAINAINEGNIFRFLTKPCGIDVFSRALNDAVDQYRLIKAEKELLENTLQGSIKLLIDILMTISPEIFSSSSRIRRLAKRVGTRLQLENIWELELAAMLSHIGCVAISGEIIKKVEQGKSLTLEENRIYHTHPQIGMKLLSNIPRLERIAEAVEYQMKYFDGGGVPLGGKSETSIPIIARILKVVTDFDKMQKRGMTVTDIIKGMSRNLRIYDPEVFGAFEAEVTRLEEGYMLRHIPLKNLEIGMVISDDIRDKTGVLLLPRGTEITEVLQMRLRSYGSIVAEPIKILEYRGKSEGKEPEA